MARVAAEQGLDAAGVRRPDRRRWRELPGASNATNDFFIRTTDEGHKRFVQDFLQRIYDNGDIYQDVYAGLYCVGCEAFKTEAELVDGKCPDHGTAPEWIEEKNWFFRLSAYQDRLLAALRRAPRLRAAAASATTRRAASSSGGLQDFSISRAGQPWGVPIPWDPDQVAYVWADALVNYLQRADATRAPGRTCASSSGPRSGTCSAKDILRFHCVFWPALLLAAGYEVPQQLFVHGYLLLDDRKISKSLGNVIDPLDLIDVYGADPVRFWSARAVVVRPGRQRLDRRRSTSATSASSATTSATCSRGRRR